MSIVFKIPLENICKNFGKIFILEDFEDFEHKNEP